MECSCQSCYNSRHGCDCRLETCECCLCCCLYKDMNNYCCCDNCCIDQVKSCFSCLDCRRPQPRNEYSDPTRLREDLINFNNLSRLLSSGNKLFDHRFEYQSDVETNKIDLSLFKRRLRFEFDFAGSFNYVRVKGYLPYYPNHFEKFCPASELPKTMRKYINLSYLHLREEKYNRQILIIHQNLTRRRKLPIEDNIGNLIKLEDERVVSRFDDTIFYRGKLSGLPQWVEDNIYRLALARRRVYPLTGSHDVLLEIDLLEQLYPDCPGELVSLVLSIILETTRQMVN